MPLHGGNADYLSGTVCGNPKAAAAESAASIQNPISVFYAGNTG
jgi:hypothetical protein